MWFIISSINENLMGVTMVLVFITIEAHKHVICELFRF